MQRIVCNAATTGASVPSGRRDLDLRRQPIAARLGGLDRRDIIFQHDVMDRLLEAEPGQPAAMQLGPGREDYASFPGPWPVSRLPSLENRGPGFQPLC
jgi:hypothetical protein